jgi:hypothetical protein
MAPGCFKDRNPELALWPGAAPNQFDGSGSDRLYRPGACHKKPAETGILNKRTGEDRTYQISLHNFSASIIVLNGLPLLWRMTSEIFKSGQ